jgi:hypothetical protein
MTDLADLIEAADGPCRKLDAEIARVAGAEHGPRENVEYETRSVTYIDEIAPRYTASIDAAMTLVPEGCLWGVGNSCYSECCPWAWCLPVGASWDEADNSYAATPALALCAAAIRARAE